MYSVGLVGVFAMSLIINCFIAKRIVSLDHAFTRDTMHYFYPNHLRKLQSKQCPIDLNALKGTMHCLRMVLIYAAAIYIAFENVGLILIGDWDQNTIGFSLFFQFQGLLNDKGIPYGDIAAADHFVNVCWLFRNVMLPFLVGFNGLLLLYCYFVVVTFRSSKICKFMLVMMTVLQWLAFTACIGLYYWTFNGFWKDYLRDNREESIYYDPGDTYRVFWCPDWGILLLVLVDWYLLKMVAFVNQSL